ncbi:ferritin-like domain-containing protein [Methylobacterium sp. 092160098-2]|jgi:rubrerythrin|uniref:ferritin-like domain-containing protein n=1 Tax=Methylobacterium sp. 092160098-2 TaxID=3025129 RepID=UPI001D39AB30|nr:ferritin family protein [Methylobacterium sp. 092160098-2]MBY0253994.1 ferritin family protein [Methylobacterium organophilum]MDE4914676.1 ferritin family protein [Methylobacterium sp. 092160098-2]
MPPLKAEPAGTIENLADFFALAHTMETEAARSYAEFAELMRRQDRSDLAEVFERIAGEEHGHATNVSRWSQANGGGKPELERLRWPPPPTFEREDAAELAGSQLLTPYRVLSIAVHNEERAFAFWSYVAAQTRNEAVRQAAESMAREELEHVTTFRQERRRAFHIMREEGTALATKADAAELEAALAALLHQGGLAAPAEVVAELARETDMLGALASPLELSMTPPQFHSAGSLAEALAEGYLQGAEKSVDYHRVARLQELGERAILRLAKIRDVTHQLR